MLGVKITKNIFMDFLLLFLSCICVVLGVFGSFLPALPGPSISWLGIVILYFTDAVVNNYWVMGLTGLLTLGIVVLDFIIPSKGVKKFGGSKYGIWGSNIGLLLGIFSPIPLGFIIGPFVGAFVGELIFDYKDYRAALRAATGSFLGFLTSSFMKFVLCMMYLGLFLWIVYQNAHALFRL